MKALDATVIKQDAMLFSSGHEGSYGLTSIVVDGTLEILPDHTPMVALIPAGKKITLRFSQNNAKKFEYDKKLEKTFDSAHGGLALVKNTGNTTGVVINIFES